MKGSVTIYPIIQLEQKLGCLTFEKVSNHFIGDTFWYCDATDSIKHRSKA